MLYYESFPLIGDFCPKPFGQFLLSTLILNPISNFGFGLHIWTLHGSMLIVVCQIVK